MGSPSSARKTALIKATDDWLCDAPPAGEIFKDKSALTTAKGIRSCLRDHGRCAVSSDEAANTFETRMSYREAGLHFISVTKLNAYDGPTTGDGSFSQSDYNFMLKVAEQIEVAEEIVQPKAHGFQKRLKQVWGLAEIHPQEQQLFEASEEFFEAGTAGCTSTALQRRQ